MTIRTKIKLGIRTWDKTQNLFHTRQIQTNPAPMLRWYKPEYSDTYAAYVQIVNFTLAHQMHVSVNSAPPQHNTHISVLNNMIVESYHYEPKLLGYNRNTIQCIIDNLNDIEKQMKQD